MADDDKLDKLLEHILEIKVQLARLDGANLAPRLDEVEESIAKNNVRWARADIVTGAAAAVGGAILAPLLAKLGFKP